MEKICKMLKRNNKGFTLVELMVVLLIIGILVAIAIPIYNKTQDNARKTSCQANLRTIDGAVAQYITDLGKVPGESEIDIQKLVDEGYLKKVPKCPSGAEAYSLEHDTKTGGTDVIGYHAVCNNGIADHTYGD